SALCLAVMREPSHGMVVVDEEEFRVCQVRSPSGAPALRWFAEMWPRPRSMPGGRSSSSQRMTPRPRRGRGALGARYLGKGDLESGHRTYSAGMQRVQRAGYMSDVISGKRFLADSGWAKV